MNKPMSRLMKKAIAAVLIIAAAACNNSNGPDVSGIKVDATIHRFDKFLFEQVDTNHVPAGIQAMQKAYPWFANDFVMHILGLPISSQPGSDTSMQLTYREMKRFV